MLAVRCWNDAVSEVVIAGPTHDALVLLAGAVKQIFVVETVGVFVLEEQPYGGGLLTDPLCQATLHIPVELPSIAKAERRAILRQYTAVFVHCTLRAEFLHLAG